MLARRGHVSGHIVGPRLPVGRVANAIWSEPETATATWNFLPSRIVGRASSSTDSDCTNNKSSNTCEKPMGSSVATEITIGIL